MVYNENCKKTVLYSQYFMICDMRMRCHKDQVMKINPSYFGAVAEGVLNSLLKLNPEPRVLSGQDLDDLDLDRE